MLPVCPNHKVAVLCDKIAFLCHIEIAVPRIECKTLSRLIGKINREKPFSRQRHIERIIRDFHRSLRIIGVYLTDLDAHVHIAKSVGIRARCCGILDPVSQKAVKRLTCHTFLLKSCCIGICQIIRQDIHPSLLVPHPRIRRI